MIFTVPNLITLSRVGATVLMWFLFPSYPLATLPIFLWAIISDGLDGYFARKLSSTSVFGAIFDPIADKVFYLGTLWLFRDHLTVLLIMLAALPEIMLILIRFLTLAAAMHTTIFATRVGKYKMAFHCGTLILLFFASYVDVTLLWRISAIMVWFGILFSFASVHSHF